MEYGSLSEDPSFMVPGNTPAPQFLYNLTSVPQLNANNRTFSVSNGCVVGGGSAVNGRLFDRGSKSDYDNWAKFEGNEGWNWDGVLPYFRKSVTFVKPTKEMEKFGITYDIEAAWGGNTPVYASYPPYQYPGQKIMWNAWAEKEGVEVQKEHADGHAYGLFWAPTSMDPAAGYNRSFSGRGHWILVPPRDNYHLLTEHKVIKINFKEEDDARRAVSVTIKSRSNNSTTFDVRAKQEIVISAAATRTPQLLQLSGIGPKRVLETAGIEMLIDLPGVGWNLQDHAFSSTAYNFTTDIWPNPSSNATVPYGGAVVSSGVFLPASTFLHENLLDQFAREILEQDPAAYLPVDVPKELLDGYSKQKEILLAAFKSKTSAVLEHLFSGAPRGVAIYLKPFSRGIVYVNPADLEGEPIFDYRLLSNPVDLKIIVKMIQYIRNHFATSPTLRQLSPIELIPGSDVKTDEDVANWLVNESQLFASNGHSCCTAAMMPKGLGGVVDGELRVYGTRGLSVADLSIVPLIPGTHTQSTAYAIGEKVSGSFVTNIVNQFFFEVELTTD